jgi:hypothetical protein
MKEAFPAITTTVCQQRTTYRHTARDTVEAICARHDFLEVFTTSSVFCVFTTSSVFWVFTTSSVFWVFTTSSVFWVFTTSSVFWGFTTSSVFWGFTTSSVFWGLTPFSLVVSTIFWDVEILVYITNYTATHFKRLQTSKLRPFMIPRFTWIVSSAIRSVHTGIHFRRVKFSLEQATKAQRGSRCIILLFLQSRR